MGFIPPSIVLGDNLLLAGPTDTTPATLFAKIVAGNGVTETQTGTATNQTVTLAVGSPVNAFVNYAPGSPVTNALNTTVLTAVDATNMTLTFNSGPNGSVLIEGSVYVIATASSVVSIGLLDHTSHVQLGGGVLYKGGTSGTSETRNPRIIITGLTANTSYTVDLAGVATAGTGGSIISGVNVAATGAAGATVMTATQL